MARASLSIKTVRHPTSLVFISVSGGVHGRLINAILISWGTGVFESPSTPSQEKSSGSMTFEQATRLLDTEGDLPTDIPLFAVLGRHYREFNLFC